ncbi:hypothetical protein [Morganella morganii]|uniref:hypothetical protein n=1 Tax=Morganella morganii TaxID=582 RepID=UPI001BD94D77|nr:hypothetical protein [Morganella morganii]EKU5843263.1 hypothetical protein [Morganella morganii]MBT0403215.1 hypothetical protein [Morganella morganii subsp. morganii]
MNNTQLKEAACDDLTYAKSTLSLIINNDVPFDTHAFNTVEGVVEQIDRALKNVASISTEQADTRNEDCKVFSDLDLESSLNSVLGTLVAIENISVILESNSLKVNATALIELIASVKMNMESICQHIAARG